LSGLNLVGTARLIALIIIIVLLGVIDKTYCSINTQTETTQI
jgi:hypothetical protein